MQWERLLADVDKGKLVRVLWWFALLLLAAYVALHFGGDGGHLSIID